MARYTKQEVEDARAEALCLFPRGAFVYTILRSVSASGMSRKIDVYSLSDGALTYATGYVAKLLDRRRDKAGAIVEEGCGMDMAWHLAYSLSCVLYGYDEQGRYSHEGAYSLKHQAL